MEKAKPLPLAFDQAETDKADIDAVKLSHRVRLEAKRNACERMSAFYPFRMVRLGGIAVVGSVIAILDQAALPD